MPVREENHHLITMPVWGADYGMEGAQQQSWAWGVLVAQSANGCMGLNCSSFHTVASLSLHFAATLYCTWHQKRGKINEICLCKNGGLSSLLFNKKIKNLVEVSNKSSWSSLNYALLPPWILLMIPLWNTLWWNTPLCVSSPQYGNPGLIMGQP